MRLVDADRLKEAIQVDFYEYWSNQYDSDLGFMIDIILGEIDEFPAVTPPPNDPLTLDELRKMDGEPVWIKRIGGRIPYVNGYALVDRENCLCCTFDGCNAFFELYGTSWLAYRRKPEDNQRKN